MKYVGVASKEVRKLKTEKEKIVGVMKISKEQKQILDNTGIMCKDKVSLQYVSNEMVSIFKASTIKIDYTKVPAYVKYVYHPNMGASTKYTANKIGIKLAQIIEMEKKYDVKMFMGMPKEIKDVIEPYKKKMEKQYAKAEELRRIRKERKKLDLEVVRSRNVIAKVRRELREKYQDKIEKKYIKDNKITGLMTNDQYKEINDMLPSIVKSFTSSIKDEGYTLNFWNDDVEDNIRIVNLAKGITATEREYMIDALKYQIRPIEAIKSFEKKNKSKLTTVREFDLEKQIKKDVMKAQKDNPKAKAWFEALYTAYYTNKLLIPKMKKNPKLINAKEAYGIGTNEDLRALFIEKRSQGYKSEKSKEKMLSSLSELGEERKTFSLSNASDLEKVKVYHNMKKTFDSSEHGSFGFKIHNVFKIDDTSYSKDYEKLAKKINNVRISYHGTAFSSAAKIARSGFKITKPKVGRIFGDGIYGSKNSSKSLQYVGEEWSRKVGTRGVLFVCKNALGEVKQLLKSDMSRLLCNSSFKYDKIDTTYVTKGVGGIRNDEWCSKNPKQFLPIYWIDVELTKPGVYEKSN